MIPLKALKNLVEVWSEIQDKAENTAYLYIKPRIISSDPVGISLYINGVDFDNTDWDNPEMATFRAFWTETWRYGGRDNGSRQIPLRYLFLEDDEQEKAIQVDLQAERAAKEAFQAAEAEAAEQAKKAKEQAEYDRLHAEYGGAA